MNNNVIEADQPKIGRFRKSWLLTKGAWQALMLDKELLWLPVIGFFATIPLLLVFGALGFYIRNQLYVAENGSYDISWVGIALLVALGIASSAVTAIFSGAITHGAIERFKGNDPTVRGSMGAAWRRKWSLMGFGVFTAGVGYLLSYIADRIPFLGGKIIAWLAGTAWQIASFFAIPVIVTSPEPIGPLNATKQSIGVIRKVWGESLIVSLSIGAISLLATLIYAFGLAGFIVLGVVLSLSAWYFAIMGLIGFIGIIFLVLVFNMLAAFAKAAVYYYATTGTSPQMFHKDLLKQAFSPKKAKKVFV